MNILVQRLDHSAILPTRSNPTDAGNDLCSLIDGFIMPGERQLISTGLSISIPAGFYGRIAPRSGLAAKSGIDVLAGVVDSSYRGEIRVILINLGALPFDYRKGDRIAQLIIEKCEAANWVEVGGLSESDRGANGFGSSGS